MHIILGQLLPFFFLFPAFSLIKIIELLLNDRPDIIPIVLLKRVNAAYVLHNIPDLV